MVRSARKRPISAAGKASGSRSWRKAMYCAVQSPTPLIVTKLLHRVFDCDCGQNRSGSARTAAATADRAAARARGIPSIVRSAFAMDLRAEKARQRSGGPSEWRAEAATSLPARRGGGDRDLLSEHGAYGQLEAVPSARHPQARPAGDQRGKDRIVRKMRCDRERIGGQVEHPPQARNDVREDGIASETQLDPARSGVPLQAGKRFPARRLYR